LGARLFYTYIGPLSTSGSSQNYFDIGGFAYLRGKLGKGIYLQAEYARTRFDGVDGLIHNINYPLVGGGYMSGQDTWSYGAELLIPLNNAAKVYGPSYEYWINISYKF
jgi:hypothetical protein